MGIKYFVYVKNSHGLPEPQIWYSILTDGNGEAKPALFLKKLEPEEDGLSLRDLIAKYPYEEKDA